MSHKYVAVAFNLPLDKFFWYRVPSGISHLPAMGQRVIAPFKNKKLTGFIVGRTKKKPIEGLKEFLQVFDTSSPLNKKLLKLAIWMSRYYCCSLGQSLHSLFPFPFPYQEKSSVNLEKKNEGSSEDKKVFLVVPGDRKFEFILSRIRENQQNKKQTVILVPEISLLPKLQKRLESEGLKTITFHSRLSPKERYQRWLMMKKGEVELALGTRSIVFAPFPRIGAIILDQEESTDYKQKETPKYNASQVAIKRGDEERFPIFLISNAPSVDSWYEMKKGYYNFINFSERKERVSFHIVDLRKERRENRIFSQLLQQKIRDTLDSGDLIMLFVPRRGYASFLLCRECGEVIRCPECNIGLNLHLKKEMICHYCGFQKRAPLICPFCQGTELRKVGWGTQRIEMQIKKKFPQARVERLDLDVSKNSSRSIREKIKRRSVDILVGTQLLIREEILSRVNLAGVILVDILLNLPDFRASERTFQLLTRIRQGIKKEGALVVQTYNPAHYCLTSKKKEDFYTQELRIRKTLMYPPYQRWVRILLEGKSKKKVREKGEEIKKKLEKKGLSFLGPSPCPLSKLKGDYRYHLILRDIGKNSLKDIMKQIGLFAGRDSVKVGVDVDPLFTM